MANLTWFPYDIVAWEKRTRDLGLTLEEEGAIMRLIRAAWQGSPPCTILDNDEEFVRILGKQWRRGLPVLRQHFTPDPTTAGRLRCAWLAEAYERAHQKHSSYVERGKRGGRPTKETAKAVSKPQPRQSKAEVTKRESSTNENESSTPVPFARENKAEGFSCAPSEHTTKTPAPGGALALEGARASDAEFVDVDWDVVKASVWDGLNAQERISARLRAVEDMKFLRPASGTVS